MKLHKIVITVGILALISCTQRQKSPILKINKEVIDFGQIKSDSVLKVYFEYQNGGTDSLQLMNATVDCGCTTVNYKKEKIAPGEKGIIEVIYLPKSNNDSGFVTKNVALMTNASLPIKVIKIKGAVIK